MMHRIIVAGSRTFNDYKALKRVLDHYIVGVNEAVTIISGGARGADALAERYAWERCIPFECYPANWKKYGLAAGPIRNEQMAANGDALIAFWDGKSRGTKHMIETATRRGLAVLVVYYK